MVNYLIAVLLVFLGFSLIAPLILIMIYDTVQYYYLIKEYIQRNKES